MEGEKRKRRNDCEMDGKKAKGRVEDNGGQSVTEDEVEEFFAILRRMQNAIQYFQKDDAQGHKLTENRWNPCFELADFEEDKTVQGGGKKGDGVDLDLNSDPPPR